jgi:hypothetical protein
MSFYSDQAKQLLQIKATIQARLTNEGKTLAPDAYEDLQAKCEELADQADAMIADDVQASLAKLQLDQGKISASTASLLDAVKKIQRLDQILAIVAASVTLATAIASANPMAIGQALVGAEKAVATAVTKPDGLAIAANSESGE